MLPRKAVRGEQGTGRGSKPSYTPVPTAAGTSQKASTEKPKKDLPGDVGPPPKKTRQTRDERKFGKDTDTALRESAMDASLPNAASTHKLEETEYQPPEEEEEEEYVSEGDDSSDSDFGDAGPQLSKGGVRKNKTPPGRGSHSMAVGSTTRNNPQEKSVSKKVANKIGVETKNKLKTAVPTAKTVRLTPTVPTSPPVSSSPRLGVRKMPKWTPPGPANRGNNCRDDNLGSTERTGGTPLIRVGLSRKARVKPLHNSSHIPHL